jgi:hypothetical protein
VSGPDPARRDEVARRAARLFRDGRSPTVSAAIAETLRRSPPGTPRPNDALVRRHLEAIDEEERGHEGHADAVRNVREAIAEWMETLAALPGEPAVHLVGRAAAGELDGDLDVHLRVATDLSIGTLAATLVSHGAPEPAFSAVHGPFGTFDRLGFDEPPLRIRVTRCPPRTAAVPERDLVTGKPQPALDLASFRRSIGPAD